MDYSVSQASQTYGLTKKVTAGVGPDPVRNVATDTLQSFSDILKDTEQTSQRALIEGTDPHDLVHTLAQTELAVEAAVTIRNKVVEAYQEILRMPV